MSQSCLCSRLMFCYMKCQPFSCLSTHRFCLPHCWCSCSLLAVISLRDIALWYCFTLVSVLFCFSISELSSENMRTCFQIINAYIYLSATDFLQVGGKKTSNKQTFKDWNDCVNITLFALSQKMWHKSEQTSVWCSSLKCFFNNEWLLLSCSCLQDILSSLT